jgi:hypothetical protein
MDKESESIFEKFKSDIELCCRYEPKPLDRNNDASQKNLDPSLCYVVHANAWKRNAKHVRWN